MDTKKISDTIYKETMEDINKAKEKAAAKFYKKPWFYVAIAAGVVLIIGIVVGVMF
jgi:ElaB/YqjD/DUF883 family membrane-anchored ribosome-binding protein